MTYEIGPMLDFLVIESSTGKVVTNQTDHTGLIYVKKNGHKKYKYCYF